MDLECPQMPENVKGMVPSSELLGGGGTFKRWGLVGSH
jgi:hypothetical protein